MKKEKENVNEQLILDAAINEFLDKGFNGARTQSIAQAAGVSHAMLHYYYRTKEHLFEKVLDMKLSQLVDTIFSIIAGQNEEKTVEEKIFSVVSAHFDFVVEEPRLPLFVVNEIMQKQDRIDFVREKIRKNGVFMFQQMQREFNQAAEQGRVAEMDFLQLMIDAAVLNISSALSVPLLATAIGADTNRYLQMRKEENLEIIRRRILPLK